MAWRAMTAEEMVTRPEARLGGSLLLLVVCAGTLAIAFVVAMVLVMLLIASGQWSRSMGNIFSSGPAGLGALHSVPLLYLHVWAMGFSLLTLTRSPLAPGFAAGGLVGWLGVRLATSVIAQFWIANLHGGDRAGLILQSLVPILLVFVGEIMLVAGFWIWMRDGDRPNAYYRRLVRA